MTLKVIEVLSESDKGWEDAAQKAVTTAGKTLHGIRSIWVKNLNAVVVNGKITSWRLDCKISFQLDGEK